MKQRFLSLLLALTISLCARSRQAGPAGTPDFSSASGDIVDGAVLHAWRQSFRTITESMENCARDGVQVISADGRNRVPGAMEPGVAVEANKVYNANQRQERRDAPLRSCLFRVTRICKNCRLYFFVCRTDYNRGEKRCPVYFFMTIPRFYSILSITTRESVPSRGRSESFSRAH